MGVNNNQARHRLRGSHDLFPPADCVGEKESLMTGSTRYFLSEAVSDVEFIQVEEFDTVVVKMTDYPMAEMPAAFDSAFAALFPVLEAQGISPIGPAYSLHRRMPTDTATFEAGIPVDKLLADPVTTETGVVVESSQLPAGNIARVSYFGPYEAMGEAWGSFMYAISTSGKQPDLPFWEIYVTEPSPEIDPATLRTDLVVKITG
jgi:effector-binding domain-containing protein